MLKPVQHGAVMRILVAVLWVLCLVCPAYAQTFPALTARFVDAANLLRPEEASALETKLAEIERTTGHQVFVATIPDLQGYALEDYGNKLLRAWAPGTKEKDDGIVLFVAPNEPAGKRGPRIEVGYGLEPVVTDAFASVLANSVMTPMLRAGDIAGALNAGVDAIGEQIKLTPEEASKRTAALAAEQTKASRGVNPGAFVFWIVVFFFVILPLVGRMGGGRRHRSGIGEAILWTAINVAANSGRDNDGGWGGGGGFGGGGDFGGGGGGGGGGGFGGGGGGSGGGGGASGGW